MSLVLKTAAAAAALAFTASASYVSTCTDGYGATIACPSSTTTDSPAYTPAPPPAYPTVYPNATAYPSAIDVPGWKYDDCVSSSEPSEFSLVEVSSAMTIERCLLDCSAYQFALIHGEECYCSQEVTSAITAGGNCHTPCPADPTEACGGQQGVAPYRRRHVQNQKRADDPSTCTDGYGDPTACPSETSAASPTDTSYPIVGGPLYSLYEKAIVPEGDLFITVITQIYLEICDECPGGYSTCTASSTATATGCGCSTPIIPVIPMVTTVATCNSCHNNGPATVTITTPECTTTDEPITTPCPETTIHVEPAVPTYVVSNTTAYPSIPVYTGAAMVNAMEKGVAGVAAALAVVAML